MVVAGLIALHFAPEPLSAGGALRTAVVFTIGISLGWELIYQPIFHAHRAPDRSGLDGAQILCDLLGISAGQIITRHYQAWMEGKSQQLSSTS
jgi:hypothetical protein